MDVTTQVISLLVVVITLSMIMVGGVVTRRLRRRGLPLPALRVIPAYESVPKIVGYAAEANQPVHMAFGSAGIGGPSTVLTLASAELFYQITAQAVIGDTLPVLTSSDASTLPIAQDTLRRALKARGRIDRFDYTAARWYPSGARSLTYAAAISALVPADDVSTSVFAGSHGIELALMAEANRRHNRSVIALSDQLEGQAVAFAYSNEILIGEEVFAAGAYLGRETGQIAQIITLDSLRAVLVIALIVLLISRFTGTGG